MTHKEWLLKMADAEDSCPSVSVGGLAADCGMAVVNSGELCPICGCGFILPSRTCDHCDTRFGKAVANVTVQLEGKEIIESLQSEIETLRRLLGEVYRQAGNEAGTIKRHALTPGLRDEIRDYLLTNGLWGEGTT